MGAATAEKVVQEGAEEPCRREAEEVDEYFKRSASLNSSPIRSGIGLKDVFEMVREGISADLRDQD
jgi:hypothetical protein